MQFDDDIEDGGGSRPVLDAIEHIIDAREWDVPYHIRVAIDKGTFQANRINKDIRIGKWYTVKAKAGQVTIEVIEGRLKRADPVVLAFDIETSKSPLKFPDATIDSIMMISYMIDGQVCTPLHSSDFRVSLSRTVKSFLLTLMISTILPNLNSKDPLLLSMLPTKRLFYSTSLITFSPHAPRSSRRITATFSIGRLWNNEPRSQESICTMRLDLSRTLMENTSRIIAAIWIVSSGSNGIVICPMEAMA